MAFFLGGCRFRYFRFRQQADAGQFFTAARAAASVPSAFSNPCTVMGAPFATWRLYRRVPTMAASFRAWWTRVSCKVAAVAFFFLPIAARTWSSS